MSSFFSKVKSAAASRAYSLASSARAAAASLQKRPASLEKSARHRALMRCRTSQEGWASLDQVQHSDLDSNTAANDGLLRLVPAEQCAEVRDRVAAVAHWVDFLNIFDLPVLKEIPLPPQRMPTVEQATMDAEREVFGLSVETTEGAELTTVSEAADWETVREELAKALGWFGDREANMLLRCASRTLAGGDSYFVCADLLSGESLLCTPSSAAEGRANPIIVEVYHGGILSIVTTSMFDVRSVEKIDGREMVEVRATHVLNLDLRGCRDAGDEGRVRVKRTLYLESPESKMASDVEALMM